MDIDILGSTIDVTDYSTIIDVDAKWGYLLQKSLVTKGH